MPPKMQVPGTPELSSVTRARSGTVVYSPPTPDLDTTHEQTPRSVLYETPDAASTPKKSTMPATNQPSSSRSVSTPTAGSPAPKLPQTATVSPMGQLPEFDPAANALLNPSAPKWNPNASFPPGAQTASQSSSGAGQNLNKSFPPMGNGSEGERRGG